MNVKLHTDVNRIWGRGHGGVLFTDDTDSKTGRTVMEVLREKQPVLITPKLSDPDWTSLKDYIEDPEVLSLDLLEEDVAWVVTLLPGSYGSIGGYVIAFHICLISFGKLSNKILTNMVDWAN